MSLRNGGTILDEVNNGASHNTYKVNFKKIQKDLFMIIDKIIKKENIKHVQR